MNSAFADTYYYLALLSEDDAAHGRSLEIALKSRLRMVTTAWVLTEVADAMSAPRSRSSFLMLLRELRSDPATRILPPSEELFDAGLQLYASRPDKDWSLTDCISFIVMQREQLRDALTGDRHFEQAGFNALLK